MLTRVQGRLMLARKRCFIAHYKQYYPHPGASAMQVAREDEMGKRADLTIQ